jgi:UDP:flavonoid glycosyltransferase YjiC (YdhE family)
VTAEPNFHPRKRRIVLATFGSLGDLHPYIAVALGLKARGHDAVLATGECYRGKIEALGLGFRAVRPDCDKVTDHDVMPHFMDGRLGTIRILRDAVLPALRESYDDTRAAAEGADLLVSHPLAYAVRFVAEMTGIPWVSSTPTPLGLFSAYDPPILPLVPDVAQRFRFLGPAFWGPAGHLLRWASRPLARPWYRLRKELGLPPARDGTPLTDGFSPRLHLALFSKLLADKQRDWPPQTLVTGYPFYDRHGEGGLPAALERFMDDGPPPLVFTLGWSAAMVTGRFYEHSAAAAKRLGRRAVLILGSNPRNLPARLPAGVAAFDYAPFSELFPRAAAVVHHGGIGTTGLAMRSGRPMLVVPFAHDNPDNAVRAARLGIARVIPRGQYTTSRVTGVLRRLLDDPSYAQRSAEVAEAIQSEDGVRVACDALEQVCTESPLG